MRWSELSGFGNLRKVISGYLSFPPLPVHHILVPEISWHSTIIAILQINRTNASTLGFQEFCNAIFADLINAGRLRQEISGVLKPFDFVAQEIRCFDDSTTIQFQDNKAVDKLRSSLRPILSPHVARIIGFYSHLYDRRSGQSPEDRVIIESLLDHKAKSIGTKLFGSIARSPCRQDTSCIQWEEPIKEVRLTCNKLHLLVSDDALTNAHLDNVNDLLFSF